MSGSLLTDKENDVENMAMEIKKELEDMVAAMTAFAQSVSEAIGYFQSFVSEPDDSGSMQRREKDNPRPHRNLQMTHQHTPMTQRNQPYQRRAH